MKYPALSLWQPWAIMLGPDIKDFENRSWSLPEKFLNTPILIHAAKKKDLEEWEYAASLYGKFTRGRASLAPLDDDCFKFGGIVGWVIFDKVTMDLTPFWRFNNYGFHIKEFHELEFFPCRGHQKIFYVDVPEGFINVK